MCHAVRHHRTTCRVISLSPACGICGLISSHEVWQEESLSLCHLASPILVLAVVSRIFGHET